MHGGVLLCVGDWVRLNTPKVRRLFHWIIHNIQSYLPKLNDNKKPVAVLGYISHDQLISNDIPVLGNVLRKLGEVHTLNLVLHSPGGDGTVVEKFVALCRTHCKRFRVVIPTEAKSAATLIALGADEIVMGPPSEIGPIDAQVPIQVSGVRRYASAQSFIDARDNLVKQYNEAVTKNEDTGAILQMLASLDLPFIVECERLMDFGRDVGKTLLEKYMFSRLSDKSSKANDTVKQLSSVELHKVHGRTIDAATAKRDLGLKVRLCGYDDPFWNKVWEWYTRAEIMLARGRAFKLFETKHEQLLGAYQG
jgi:ATP-dependent protease ClpP protease subunit